MKKILYAVLLFSLHACSKTDDPTNEKQKIIDRALICTEKPVLSTSDEIFIGVRYFKNYSEADKISLTLDGKQGTVQDLQVEDIEGTNYLFKFPAVASSGNFELVLSIQNNQNTFTQKKIIRILDSYSLQTVWDSFDHTYLLKSFPLMVSSKSLRFQPLLDVSLGFTVNIGTYFEVAPQNALGLQYSPFLRGINGVYIANYDERKKLENISVINGDPFQNPDDSYQKTVNEVAAVYGPATSTTSDNQGNEIASFQTTGFHVTVYERKFISGVTGSPIVTVITSR